MKLRTTLIEAATVTATLAACTGSAGGGHAPAQSTTAQHPESRFRYIPNPEDTDTIIVNCAKTPDDQMGISLTNPRGDTVIQTLGATEIGDTEHRKPGPQKLLGGITIYALGKEKYAFATSDGQTAVVNMDSQTGTYPTTIPIQGRPYELDFQVYADPIADNSYIGSIACITSTAATTSARDRS